VESARASNSAFAVDARPPAYDHGVDALTRFHVLPIAADPLTWEGKNIRADVILTKELDWPVRGGFAFVNEGIQALLPRCHPPCRSADQTEGVAFEALGLVSTRVSKSAASLASRSAFSFAVFSRTA
jgi:hypothetical protein